MSQLLRACPHKVIMAFEDWHYECLLLGKILKGEVVGSTVYYAWPFRGACSDCRGIVVSRGPEALVAYSKKVSV